MKSILKKKNLRFKTISFPTHTQSHILPQHLILKLSMLIVNSPLLIPIFFSLIFLAFERRNVMVGGNEILIDEQPNSKQDTKKLRENNDKNKLCWRKLFYHSMIGK